MATVSAVVCVVVRLPRIHRLIGRIRLRRLRKLNPRGLRLAIATFAILALYAPVFPSLIHDWASAPSLSHGFAIPGLAGYLLWMRRREIVEAAVHPLWHGLPVVAAALTVYVAGMRGAEPFLARVSMPVHAVGDGAPSHRKRCRQVHGAGNRISILHDPAALCDVEESDRGGAPP